MLSWVEIRFHLKSIENQGFLYSMEFLSKLNFFPNLLRKSHSISLMHAYVMCRLSKLFSALSILLTPSNFGLFPELRQSSYDSFQYGILRILELYSHCQTTFSECWFPNFLQLFTMSWLNSYLSTLENFLAYFLNVFSDESILSYLA